MTAAHVEDLTRLLVGHGPEFVLNETTSLEALQTAQREGHLWVALTDDVPVGFAHAELIARDAVHLEEIDVHPDHGRRGLGAKLVLRVCEWAAAELADAQAARTRRVTSQERG